MDTTGEGLNTTDVDKSEEDLSGEELRMVAGGAPKRAKNWTGSQKAPKWVSGGTLGSNSFAD